MRISGDRYIERRLIVHITKSKTLEEAYRLAPGNDGTPASIAGVCKHIESSVNFRARWITKMR
ncbi:MAG: hypothetical protein DMG70_06900 [Acidobacteria bacterium]|nr:MAG: hypothetical protein DMG70_06900 [Acidobacteriota bacterium]PYY07383.1 MAG: hypothetical protein DMG69_19485 [Acidobacteriota bacterium]